MRTSQWLKVVGFAVALSVVLMPLAVGQEGGGEGRQGRQGRTGRGTPAEGARAGRMRTGGGMMAGFGMDKSMLLRSTQVQEELKVSEEQKGKIEEALTAYQEKSRERLNMQGLRDLSAEEREKRMEEWRKAREKLSDELDKDLAKILNKDQMKRLNGIQVQQQGIMALMNEKVAKELKITEEQKKKLEAAQEEGREKQMKLFEDMRAEGGGQPNREAMTQMREKREAIQKETEAAILGVLTADQKKAFDEMKGKPFELDRQSLMRGRGGFGGQQPRGERGQRGERPEGATRRQRPQAEE